MMAGSRGHGPAPRVTSKQLQKAPAFHQQLHAGRSFQVHPPDSSPLTFSMMDNGQRNVKSTEMNSATCAQQAGARQTFLGLSIRVGSYRPAATSALNRSSAQDISAWNQQRQCLLAHQHVLARLLLRGSLVGLAEALRVAWGSQRRLRKTDCAACLIFQHKTSAASRPGSHNPHLAGRAANQHAPGAGRAADGWVALPACPAARQHTANVLQKSAGAWEAERER